MPIQFIYEVKAFCYSLQIYIFACGDLNHGQGMTMKQTEDQHPISTGQLNSHLLFFIIFQFCMEAEEMG